MPVFTVDPSDLDNLSAISPTSPSDLKSVTAFARFEFEPGKGNGGTKVLMVEWEDEDSSRHTAGGWMVSWQGKSTSLHADDKEAENLRRAYFLLGPGQQIPRTITLSYEPPPDSAATAKKSQKLMMTPLPAIFPPQLGEVARQSGKKGVLHTIWAKKRLQVLEREIQQEQEFNLEGIALEMAIAERKWIENNFGVTIHSQNVGSGRNLEALPSISSPKSPGPSRLNEKLKGLSLGTSEKVLNKNNEGKMTRAH
ncbi:hypothetical protein UCRPC4_g05208 [Phaeomoniella chlamydospora]|uniref:Uncharacterized protein n=1 Tax=Phaeomoniella chlamydospora TaxID=158046 RepID=A0A0G2GMB8_PHACM|nr:hypothetical protein UCRPC4_g05208 [Phaeomoniella chlamydospora]